MPKIASLAHWQCSYWSRSESESKSTLGFRIPSKPNPATRSGLGSFLHPPSRKTPTPLSVKMFAVAAQTTVRATAQVKATKVAAKEQKSAYVPSRFPASSISRRFFHPGDRRPARYGAETTTTNRARRSRADASRIDAYRYRAYRTPRRSRASSRVVSELVRVARTTKSWKQVARTRHSPFTVSLPLLRPQFPLLQGCRRRRRAVPVRVPRRVRGRPHAAERHQLRARQVRAALLRSPPRGGG